ncbi:hypothetical protein DMN91_003139 [Ooceraea biroi]|uniref:Translational activator of cytochrome c oxidase n=1 Tax=Ooceraea biroi TaxID=2015173 RepID=A0A026WKV1_OOCBI|nr:translational activator of cytochrome c oxidase 1 [Ooceraea biroi]EZA56593.1 Translational activator of cytochrome c oxidase [Ooceraea biroi]RLU25047.1 hypothetical protein DMN91_003139 [Ooceraea biroi]
MTQLSSRLLLNRYLYSLCKDSKRFAGHSKWANIKHVKAEKDHERMVLFRDVMMKMRIAIREGGSTKPSNNMKLAKLVEHAKKLNMSATTVTSFLERMEARKNKTLKGITEVRGPNGYVMLVSYLTDNPKAFAIELNTRLRKTSGKVTDTSAIKMFTHIGSIMVEKKGDLEQAMEDAINIGAEDVEEFKENDKEYFQFKCDPNLVNKIKNLLENYQYSVLSAEETYIPKTVIQLNESDLEAISKIHDKISDLEDITNVHDNLA